MTYEDNQSEWVMLLVLFVVLLVVLCSCTRQTSQVSSKVKCLAMGQDFYFCDVDGLHCMLHGFSDLGSIDCDWGADRRHR